MTRLVCMADTHMFHADLVVPDGDILIHAGDMGRAGDVDELSEVSRWLGSLPHRVKIIVAGNHDFLFQTEPARARELFPAAHFVYLEDSAADVDGLRFYGSPWTPIFFDWAFMKKRGAALAERWSLIPSGLDVLITHGPPLGILDDAGAYRDGGKHVRHVGCEALLERVRVVKPRVHIFGHIHENRGVVDDGGIRFVNCTTSECEKQPLVVDV